jgi:hypothetical protein
MTDHRHSHDRMALVPHLTTTHVRLAPPAAHPSFAALTLAGLALAAVGCGGNQKVTPPPPPFRPEPIEQLKVVAPTRTDCDVPDPAHARDALTYAERLPLLSSAQQLAAEGLAKLQSAEGASLDPKTREELITDAVDDFLSALGDDPYNVNATYNLAAAYARIGRKQCSLNLLSRLVLMKDHASRKAEVAAKFDRLLGRNNVTLDPDFRDMRNEDRFRCVITNLGAVQQTDCFATR